MTKYFLSYLFFLLSLSAFSQDDYHNYLQNFLMNDYSLPAGEWVFYKSEVVNYQSATGYGGNYSVQDINDQEFSKKVRAVINNAGNNPWDSGWKIDNKTSIQEGDQILAVFFLRSENGEGIANFFVENNNNFSKDIYLELPVSEEWRRYLVPFTSMSNYNLNSSSWGFHLGKIGQTIEIGGFTALNYGKDIDLADLPSEVNNQFYGGHESDAPWRDEAAERIEQIRKADLNIKVTDMIGNPVDNALVQVNMIRHDFQFGSAVVASRLANNPNHNIIYENKVSNLDGNGHGFNTVVFENDMKWDAWEEEWFVNKAQLNNAVIYLRNQNIDIRGHNLVWPGTPYLPNDIPQNYDNIPYIKERVMEHIERIMTSPIGKEIHDWDVLNEIVVNQNLANAFSADPNYDTGREFYAEIFEKAREIDPNTELWLNDYVTLTLNNSAGQSLYEGLRNYTAELVDAGVDINGIGFQAHIGGFPNSIYEVLGTLDDFHEEFGLKAKITEFDLPSFVDEELAGDYLRDFMTAIYSHESTDGFLFWSFWDGQTYMNAGTNLYRQDWSETPSHATFVDLLFNQWWTEAALQTTDTGLANARVFKGLYEISYECDGSLVRDTLSIVEAMDYEIVCDNIATDVNELAEQDYLKIFPNPSQGILQLERSSNEAASVRVFDATGKNHLQSFTTDRNMVFDLAHLRGVFFVEFRTEQGVVVEKIVLMD